MKRLNPAHGYRIEDLVTAAYKAARQVTSDPLLATMIVSAILEDWLMKSGRADLVKQLQSVPR